MKSIRKIILMILVVASFITGMNIMEVNAKTAPNKVTMKPKSSLYYFNNGTNYISGYHFYRKQLTDGTWAYCVSNINTSVPAGMTLSVKNMVKDNGLDYIIKNGWPNKKFTGDDKKDYYITQAAIWEYYDQTKGSNNWGSTSFTATSTGMKKHVFNLVSNAKIAKNTPAVVPSITIKVSDNNMYLNNERTHFVSKPIDIQLVSTKGTYTVELVEGPRSIEFKNEKGEVKNEFNEGEKLVVYVPASSIGTGESGTISFKVKAMGVTSRIYKYTTGKPDYQEISPVIPYEIITEIGTETPITLKFAKDPTRVKISKQDITTKKELPGATLTVKDKNGNIKDEWVSTNEPHYIEGLEPGEYTLTEKIAPAGYVLSKEEIKFTVQDDGTVPTVTMYNSKEIITKVKISKQDITTKKELPGATLTVKDKNGKVVAEWVSTNEPHYIEKLEPGDYTLTEKIAPDGYILSKEEVKFTVKADGSVTTATMYNTPLSTVKVSKQDITTKKELPGATLTVKDKNGKVIDEWVSGSDPHYIEKLEPGEYTLTEKIAPDGYTLSKEEIKFTVKADGSITTVTMYNTPVTKVQISKQDITDKKELPGATLVVKDKDGKVVEEWVSGEEPHYIEGLEPGDYTLTEKIAPDGYLLSEETIEFTVKADGNVTSVVMYNAKETKVTKVKISKQDITTKKELPGATLVIKDKNGKVIEEWISGEEPHYIEGLEAGDYTLTEKIAPKGYLLSKETIKFTINADGSLTSVTMYNTPYVEVPKTDLNVSSLTIIIASILITLGTGLVVYYVKIAK